MAIRISHIRLSGGFAHEHIAHLWWTNPATGKSGDNDRSTIVSWIENDGGKAYVEDAQGHRADVAVIAPSHGEKYLRTHADGVWTDNLLSLPHA